LKVLQPNSGCGEKERKKNKTTPPPPVTAVAAVVVVLELMSLGQNVTDYKRGQTTQDQNLNPHEYICFSV